MEFAKLQGSGNDFILIDNRDKRVEKFLSTKNIDLKDFVVKLCARHTGVGADGLILLEEPEDKSNHFKWRFFNADGSVAEMCGNGSRCAVRFAYQMGICPDNAKFETLAGVIHAQVKDQGRRVKVKLTKPHSLQDKSIEIDGKVFKGTFINTGVPHYVVPVQDLDKLDVIKYGRSIRFHQEFQPKGTNVNFIEGFSEEGIRIRTYERGVEGETLACGTGATASAIVSYLKGLVSVRPVKVLTKGGEVLSVDFDDSLQEVYLEGDVQWVFDGYLKEI